MVHENARPEISPRLGTPASSSSPSPTMAGRPPWEQQVTRLAPATPQSAISSAREPPSWRCREKGCVFPARADSNGECFYHRLQQLEPEMFESLQPSVLMQEQAKFGLPEEEPDDSRVVDRHRQAEERAAFLFEGAP